LVLFSGYVQDSQVMISTHQEVNCLSEKDVVGRQGTEGREDVDRVKIVRVNDEAARGSRSLTGIAEGTEDTEGFKKEDEICNVIRRRR
jgi:hypothetical protein